MHICRYIFPEELGPGRKPEKKNREKGSLDPTRGCPVEQINTKGEGKGRWRVRE